MNMEHVAEAINILGAFCGPRDVDELSRTALQASFGVSRADVAVLFGGSILAGGDVMAQTMQRELAEKYILVGGRGHTTDALRQNMERALQKKMASDASEAEMFQLYLKTRYGLAANHLECQSTNCGNNITFLLDLLQREKIPHRSILMIQDASMQRRMTATWCRQAGDSALVVNYAAYRVHVTVVDGSLRFTETPPGMWDMKRYIRLLLGDTARLRDDENGYGPRGKGFLAHVDTPREVESAFRYLKQFFPVRAALEHDAPI